MPQVSMIASLEGDESELLLDMLRASAAMTRLFDVGAHAGASEADLAAVVAMAVDCGTDPLEAIDDARLVLEAMTSEDPADIAEWQARGIRIGVDEIARRGFAELYAAMSHAQPSDGDDIGEPGVESN